MAKKPNKTKKPDKARKSNKAKFRPDIESLNALKILADMYKRL